MTDPDGPPAVRRQYATLDGFEQAHGDDPQYVEDRLNALHGRVMTAEETRTAVRLARRSGDPAPSG